MKKTIGICSAFITFFLLSCSSNLDISEHGDMAYETAIEDYIKPQMSFPDETDFNLLPVGNDFSKNDSVYHVCGRGTTKNGFGVKVPFVFKCKLKYLGGDDSDSKSWELIDEVELTQ